MMNNMSQENERTQRIFSFSPLLLVLSHHTWCSSIVVQAISNLDANVCVEAVQNFSFNKNVMMSA